MKSRPGVSGPGGRCRGTTRRKLPAGDGAVTCFTPLDLSQRLPRIAPSLVSDITLSVREALPRAAAHRLASRKGIITIAGRRAGKDQEERVAMRDSGRIVA